MAWTNADWEQQATYALQLSKLKAFRTELRNAVSASVTEDGVTHNPETVRMLLSMTDNDLKRIEQLADAEAGKGLPRLVSTVSPRQAY